METMVPIGRWLVVSMVLALASGCGGPNPEDEEEDWTASLVFPDCDAPGDVRIEGTLGEETVGLEGLENPGHVFENCCFHDDDGEPMPGYLEILDYVDFEPPREVVRFEFDRTVSHGRSVAARGQVDLESYGGPRVGNCETGEAVSLFYDLGDDSYQFALRNPSDAPFCDGALREGVLTGCYRPPEF